MDHLDENSRGEKGSKFIAKLYAIQWQLLEWLYHTAVRSGLSFFIFCVSSALWLAQKKERKREPHYGGSAMFSPIWTCLRIMPLPHEVWVHILLILLDPPALKQIICYMRNFSLIYNYFIHIWTGGLTLNISNPQSHSFPTLFGWEVEAG